MLVQKIPPSSMAGRKCAECGTLMIRYEVIPVGGFTNDFCERCLSHLDVLIADALPTPEPIEGDDPSDFYRGDSPA